MKKVSNYFIALFALVSISINAQISSVLTGSGTTGYLPKFMGQKKIGNSLIKEENSSVNADGVVIKNRSITMNESFLNNPVPGQIECSNLIATYGLFPQNIIFQNTGYSRIYGSSNYGINVITGGGDYFTLDEGRLRLMFIPQSRVGLPVGAVWDSLGYLKIVR